MGWFMFFTVELGFHSGWGRHGQGAAIPSATLHRDLAPCWLLA